MKKKIMKEGNKSLQDKTEKELKVKNDKKLCFFPEKRSLRDCDQFYIPWPCRCFNRDLFGS